MYKYNFVIIFFLTLNLQAQKRILRGKVTDSLQNPIEFANIMAKPVDNNFPFVFAVTDEKGIFEVRLKNKQSYKISVSFMGYKTYSFTIDSLQMPKFRNIVLKPTRMNLDEVVIDYKTPVKITEDSIVYNVKHFVNGKERKLKAVLNKLPGVKVDKNGQISVMGKHISKVMVEGKEFFGGDSKLAVENIPADAVKSIQVIKDYNSVSFMKGLNDEQKRIINIKLKQGKKRFVFGDLTAGGNIQADYLGKAGLFYFSPKTNLSYIGNLNDIGEPSLDINDIRRFESTNDFFSKKIKIDESKKSLLNFAYSKDFKSRKTNFNALQWQQNFGKKWDFQSYFIYNTDESVYKKTEENTFLTQPAHLQLLDKITTVLQKNGLGKVSMKFNPNDFQSFDYQFFINKNKLDNEKTNKQINPNKSVFDYQQNKPLHIFQILAWYKKFDKKHILKITGEQRYKEYYDISDRKSTAIFLNSLINWQPSTSYFLRQNQEKKENYITLSGKFYYKINAKNHLYFSLGNNYYTADFFNILHQITDDQSLEQSAYNSAISMNLNDLYAGVQYRFKINKTIFTPGIYLHQYVKNLDNTLQAEKKILLLPELNMETQTILGDFDLKYAFKVNYPGIKEYNDHKVIQSFDRVYMGNPYLENELYHRLNLHHSYFSLKRGIMIFSLLSIEKKITEIKEDLEIVNNNFLSYSKMYHYHLNSYDFTVGFSKEWTNFTFDFKPFISYSEDVNSVNGNQINEKNIFYNQNISLTMEGKKVPEIEIGINFSKFYDKSIQSVYEYYTYEPYLSVKADYKGFLFQTEYELQYLNNNTINNTYQLFDISLFYRKPDTAWGFEISVKNALNQQFKVNYDYLSYLSKIHTTYLQPRTILFKLHYKL
jgi:hypothetical protein